MREQLSSSCTFFYKYIFAPVWIVIILLFVVMIPVGSAQAEEDQNVAPGAWLFSAALIGAAFFTYWSLARLKKVEIDGSNLIVSNYIKSIEVPVVDVELVAGSWLMGPELVWVGFKQPTEFGQKVVFAGKWRVFYGFTQHPVVRRLQGIVEESQNTAPL